MNQLERIQKNHSNKISTITKSVLPDFNLKLKAIIPDFISGMNTSCVDPLGRYFYTANSQMIYQFYIDPQSKSYIRKIFCYGDDSAFSSITSDKTGERIFVYDSTKKELVSIDTDTGKILNTFQIEGSNISKILVSDQYVVLVIDSKELKLLDIGSLKLIKSCNPFIDKEKSFIFDVIPDRDFDQSKTLYYSNKNERCIQAYNMDLSKVVGRYDSFSAYFYDWLKVDNNFLYARDYYYGNPNSVYKWDKNTSRLITRYQGIGKYTRSYWLTSKTAILITDDEICIQDIEKKYNIPFLKFKHKIKAIKCLSNNRFVSFSDKKITSYIYKNHKIKNEISIRNTHPEANTIHIFNRSTMLLTSFNKISVWGIFKGSIECLYQHDFERSLDARSSNIDKRYNRMILTDTDTSNIYAFDLNDLEKTNVLKHHKGSIRQTLVHGGNSFFSVSWDNSSIRYSLKSSRKMKVYKDTEEHKGNSCSIAMDKKGKHLFIGSYSDPESSKETLRIYSVKSGELLKKMVFDTKSDSSTVVENWKDKMVFGGGSRSIYIIHSDTFEIIKKYDSVLESGIRRLDVHEKSDTAFFGTENGIFCKINLITGEIYQNKLTNTTITNSIFSDHYIYVGSFDGHFYKLTYDLQLVSRKKITNSRIWDAKFDSNTELIYFSCERDNFKAVDFKGDVQLKMILFRDWYIWTQHFKSNNSPWFFTNKTELITVAQINEKGEILGFLEIDSKERLEHISHYNDKRMMNNIINNTTDFLKAEEFLRLEEGVESVKAEKKSQMLLN
jgi:hypothetical protein